MPEREFNADEFPLADLINALGRQLGKARERANEIATAAIRRSSPGPRPRSKLGLRGRDRRKEESM